MFNLLEIRANNLIQVRFIDEAASEALDSRRFIRSTTHSKAKNLPDMPEMVQEIARAFPYFESLKEPAEGEVIEDVDLIRVLANDRASFRYDIKKRGMIGGQLVEEDCAPVVVTCLCDLSSHPEKVQKLAKYLFTGEVVAAEQQRIESEKRQKVITVPVVVDGVPVMEDYEAEETKIEVVGGKAVQRTVTVIKQRPKTQEVPVFDEDGNPVYE